MDIEQQVKDISKKVDIIYETIVGDPTDQECKPGLLLRQDRIERTIGNIRKGLWILFGAVIISTLKLFTKFF